jgi:hypothetical protein
MSGWEKFARRVVAMSFLSFSILCLSSFGGSRGGTRNGALPDKQNKNDVVYVCACLKTKSCSCMTMAKTGGVCACGPTGGPPLKAVPRDGDWARENRDALGK